jgi:hypothetical protein
MDTREPASTAIHYRRGFLLYWAWLALGVPAVLTAVFIAFTAQFVQEEPGVFIGLWALVIFFTLVLAAVIAPLIERFSSNQPAIIVSTEGIKTRDMMTLLPWEEIEKFTTRPVTSWAGKYTTTVNIFEICPKAAGPSPFRWRSVVDAHANPLRIAWHVLDRPEQLKKALEVHAPPALLAKSNLAGLPGPGYSA